MFDISYNTWKETCNMYFSLQRGTHKAYLQWFPFSKLSKEDIEEISGEDFFNKYINTGGFVLFPEVMRYTENYIQKSDGSFRNASLVSPILYLVLQALGKEVSARYKMQRPTDIGVYYAGNYDLSRPKYKQDYDAFFKAINTGSEYYQYFIKTDITSFYGNINVNELIDRINAICNKNSQTISQTQLLLVKELLLYCGEGYFPLIENSMASSYMATVIYLDEIDCELYEFIKTKVDDISDFQLVRYVDDMYILFSSDNDFDELTHVYNMVRNTYSSILKKHGLALNTKKCIFKRTTEINEELKKSLYDEYVNGVEADLGKAFTGKLQDFLSEIYTRLCKEGLTHEQYTDLISEYFSCNDIEYTPDEVLNYLIYEDQEELKAPEVSRLLIQIINKDVSFLSIDPKRLSVMVLQSGSNKSVRAMLNQLFGRARSDMWNSYDTTIAIAYLIQSKFQHIDLLNVIKKNCPDLYAYYYYSCRTSFICQIRPAKWNRYLKCIKNDKKAAFLFFMSLCEQNRRNYLGSYAYFKNFFDRISADIAYLKGKDPKSKKPNYNGYYDERSLKKLYNEIEDSETIIHNAHTLRNKNPLSHASAELIDNDSSSIYLEEAKVQLDELIHLLAMREEL